jgi:hypothetical protein
MISLFILAIALLFLAFIMVLGIPGTSNYLSWKLSGIWANQSDTLQIMIHADATYLHGHVVSAQVRDNNDKIVIGKMVVDKVKLKSAWNWSKGKYIDPYTMEEFDVKIKLKGKDRLKIRFMEHENIVRKEEWKLVNPL